MDELRQTLLQPAPMPVGTCARDWCLSHTGSFNISRAPFQMHHRCEEACRHRSQIGRKFSTFFSGLHPPTAHHSKHDARQSQFLPRVYVLIELFFATVFILEWLVRIHQQRRRGARSLRSDQPKPCLCHARGGFLGPTMIPKHSMGLAYSPTLGWLTWCQCM